jgi:hypothetical protein
LGYTGKLSAIFTNLLTGLNTTQIIRRVIMYDATTTVNPHRVNDHESDMNLL